MRTGLVGLLTVLSATIAGESKGFLIPRWEPPLEQCTPMSFVSYDIIRDNSTVGFTVQPETRRGTLNRTNCHSTEGGRLEYELQAGLEDTFDSVLNRINGNLQYSYQRPITPEDLVQQNYPVMRCCEDEFSPQSGGYCVQTGDQISYVLSW